MVLTIVMLVCQTGLTVRSAVGTGRLMSAAEGSTAENLPGGGYFSN